MSRARIGVASLAMGMALALGWSHGGGAIRAAVAAAHGALAEAYDRRDGLGDPRLEGPWESLPIGGRSIAAPAAWSLERLHAGAAAAYRLVGPAPGLGSVVVVAVPPGWERERLESELGRSLAAGAGRRNDVGACRSLFVRVAEPDARVPYREERHYVRDSFGSLLVLHRMPRLLAASPRVDAVRRHLATFTRCEPGTEEVAR